MPAEPPVEEVLGPSLEPQLTEATNAQGMSQTKCFILESVVKSQMIYEAWSQQKKAEQASPPAPPPLLARRTYGTAEQPGWARHSTELSVEHLAAVPEHAVQVQPAPVQAILVVFASHAVGEPVHELPAHLQPGTLTQVSVVTRLSQVAG